LRRLLAFTGAALDEGGVAAGAMFHHTAVAVGAELEILAAGGTARGAAVRNERAARRRTIAANCGMPIECDEPR